MTGQIEQEAEGAIASKNCVHPLDLLTYLYVYNTTVSKVCPNGKIPELPLHDHEQIKGKSLLHSNNSCYLIRTCKTSVLFPYLLLRRSIFTLLSNS